MDVHVYMLRCNDGSYYVGLAREGLDARLADHRSGRYPGYTHSRLPVELVWSTDFLWLKDAIACERRIKGWRREKKEALIRGDTEALKALSRTAKPLILRQAQDEDCALLIYKIVPRAEWMASTGDYDGSAHDKADGFLHFSTGEQLAETLQLYYADADDLMLVAVDAQACGDALKWEFSESRDEDFPHLYGALSCDAMKWARQITRDADGQFVLPKLD